MHFARHQVSHQVVHIILTCCYLHLLPSAYTLKFSFHLDNTYISSKTTISTIKNFALLKLQTKNSAFNMTADMLTEDRG